MPAKFKASSKKWIKDPVTGRSTNRWEPEHFYLKCQSKKTLFDAINNDNTKPKHKQKYRNELVRRGIKIVYKPVETT
tara:strand:- start:366 stop:596 length:231 start_codon:yes stop_codon:yes gene_type:complete